MNVRLSPAFHFATKHDVVILLLSAALALVQGGLVPIGTLLFGDAISNLGVEDISDQLSKICIKYAIVAAIGLVAGGLNTFFLELFAERQIRQFKLAVVKSVLRQDLAYFYQKDANSIASELEQSCVRLRMGLGVKMGLGFEMVAQFVVGYAVALWRGWRLALVMTSVTPLITVCVALISDFMVRSCRASQEAYSAAGAVVEEVIPAMRTVASYGLEEHFVERYKSGLVRTCRADHHATYFRALTQCVIFFLIFVSYALGWWYGTRCISEGFLRQEELDFSLIGDMYAVFNSVMVAAFALGQVGPAFSGLLHAAEAANKLIEIAERASQIDPMTTTEDTPLRARARGKIEFRNVGFAYPATMSGVETTEPVYSNLSFVIPAGQTVGIVGVSGCGKSTVVQLLERFYDVQSGWVLLDDRDIREYPVRHLRDQMALVSQEPRLFHSSVRDNICAGRVSLFAASMSSQMAQVHSAARLANVHNFVSALPQQYEQSVGQGGSLLSGGQRQRIAIARAVIRDAPILILDEATSALDNESERVVQQALEEVIMRSDGRRTVLIIAHRVSSLQLCDRVLVLAPGLGGASVIEDGAPSELMALENGVFRRMAAAQALHEEETSALSVAGSSLELDTTSTFPSSDYDFIALDAPRRSTLKTPRSAASQLRQISLEEQMTEPLLETPNKPLAGSLLRLWRHAWDDWHLIVLGVVSSAASGACFPVLSLLTALMFGQLFDWDDSQSIDHNVAKLSAHGMSRSRQMLWFAVYAAVFAFLQDFAWGRVSDNLVARLRGTIFWHLLRLPMPFFDRPRNHTGHLSSVLSADCALTRGVAGDNLCVLLQNAFSLSIALGISFAAHRELATISALAISGFVPAVYFQSKLTQPPRSIGVVDARGIRVTTDFIFNEIVTNLQTIATYNLQFHFTDKYTAAVDRELTAGKRTALLAGIGRGLASGLPPAATALTFWYAGLIMERDPRLTVTKVMTIILALINAGSGVGRALANIIDRKRAKCACGNIFDLLDESVTDYEGVCAAPHTGDIVLKHVNFSYPSHPNKVVLRDVSLTIPEGKSVALVGASGCGKSTIVQLLERFYNLSDTPLSSGSIYVGGVKLSDCRLRSWRSRIGLVEQQPLLFSMSVRENIRLGKLSATDAEVEAAAEKANAASFIMRLPAGYSTKISTTQLSGGQKQRIAIARAIVRDPDIFLFDETTSALDPESEAAVQKTLDTLGSGRKTTLTIAHRLSTVKRSDRIIVFAPSAQGATIVEQGTHEELMGVPGGTYRRLADLG